MGELLACVEVGCHAFGDDDSSCTCNSLEEPCKIEDKDVGGPNTECRGSCEEEHGSDEKMLSSKFVREGADEKLSSGEADHAGCETHRHECGGGVEVSCHFGEDGEVEIGDERAEGGEHAKCGGKEYGGFGHGSVDWGAEGILVPAPVDFDGAKVVEDRGREKYFFCENFRLSGLGEGWCREDCVISHREFCAR